MRYLTLALAVASLALLGAVPGRPADARKDKDVTAEQVRRAIDGGIKFLRAQERGNGNLENTFESRIVPGGLTALGTLALLNAGVPPDDPLIQRCLAYLRKVPLEQTYAVGLTTMVYVAAGQNEDRALIQKNVDWLIRARHTQGGRLIGWTYGPGGAGLSDNSNTQYALLGLHEGIAAGAKVPREVLQSIQDYYTDNQVQGGWGYHSYPTRESPTPTMTEAGFCGLLIAGMDLNSGLEELHADGTITHCGEYKTERHLENALALLNQQMPQRPEDIARMNHTFYWLYGLERCGRLSGRRFFGEKDWYRLGCKFLVDRQQPDGSWGAAEGPPIISTSFALLFLSKGRTPVLISKLVHDPEDDWNNDRNDVRNLTAYASAELFRHKPLAWQVFDARHAGDLTPDHIDELTGDLLQSPIAYFNGHRMPRFTEGEEELLKKYLDNGGFILAEACCDRDEFDKGFRELMTRLFPDTPLRKLDASHPIWTASGKFPIDEEKIALNKFELWGIDMGCKTVVVYSRHDLSCRWESNKLDDRRVHDCFDLGLNIIAYATGLEPPKPRLSETTVFKEDPTEKKSPRGYLKVGQLYHDGDWQPAPRAMPNLMLEMRKLGVDVSLQTEEVRLTDRDFPNFKFLYMHGRRGFAFSKEELKRLRFNLETGGLLLADACCGYKKSREFDESFRQMVKELWPDKKLEEIPANDDLYSAELNGTAITRVRCRRERPDGKGVDPEYHVVAPQLEGIKINGRWAVIYSKYDIGCALEMHQSSDCLGHDHASAVQLGEAVVLYAMRR